MNLGRDFRHLEQLAAQLGLPLSAVTRYAKGGSVVGWLQRLWNAVNGKGRSGDRMKATEIPAALLRTLEGLATGRTEAPEERRTGRPPSPPPPNRRGGGGQPPNVPPGSNPGSGIPPGGFTRSPFNPNYAPPLPGETTPYSEEILCVAESSNVYSFAYDYRASTLFVTFQGHKINRKSVSNQRVRHGGGTSRPQLVGRLGSTVTGERGGRGAMYAYYDVPVRVFERMQRAASKGKFVWDELRVRGTVYGHKYRYSLVQGQVSTQRGVAGVYIPRKATKEGFRTRSVADLGTGRRGFQTSTLPAQNGFSTRRRR